MATQKVQDRCSLACPVGAGTSIKEERSLDVLTAATTVRTEIVVL